MNQQPATGLTKAISIVYILFGLALIMAVICNAKIGNATLNWKTDIWIPIFLVISATGTLRLTKWGRWTSYLTSAILLLGVPIGTFLGAYMIWHLTKYRNQFNKWH